MRILIAEDDAAIRELLADMLAAVGHQTGAAATFPAAMQLLAAATWEAVLADMDLPDGDGLALAKAARARGIRAVLCTGHALPEDALAGSDIGFLQKPFRMDALLAALDPPQD